jgi:hypothetical protein
MPRLKDRFIVQGQTLVYKAIKYHISSDGSTFLA